MLLLMTLLIMQFHVEVSGEVASIMEFTVGAMLVVLALDMFRRLRSIRMHSHQHFHRSESVHDHLHVHLRSETHEHESHAHVHAAKDNYFLRPLLVGLMHGMAGSAALILVVISTVTSVRTAVMYVIFFSVGAMAGMGALSIFIAAQLRRSALFSLEFASRVRGYAAIVVLSMGLFMMLRIGLDLV